MTDLLFYLISYQDVVLPTPKLLGFWVQSGFTETQKHSVHPPAHPQTKNLGHIIPLEALTPTEGMQRGG